MGSRDDRGRACQRRARSRALATASARASVAASAAMMQGLLERSAGLEDAARLGPARRSAVGSSR